jgi:flavin reductase (DIM6/NTAB) family NADH-FMN oxidoreductase RutF
MRIQVPREKAYLLLNHGPTTLVTAAHGGRANIMAVAWAMALDIDPPKVTLVISADSFTRSLMEKSGEFALSLPSTEQVDLTLAVGHSSGGDTDKFKKFKIATFPGSKIKAPLVEGCLGWMECRRIPEPHIEKTYDLFVAEVLAAWAEDSLFGPKGWTFREGLPSTIHHIGGSVFTFPGGMLTGKKL